MREPSPEAGLTLIEVLIATAVAGFLTLALVAVAQHMIHAAESLNARTQAASAANALQERIESDADSAWGIWVPAADLLGKANADGHELDFLSEDASHRIYAWAYRYDSAANLVTRYAYAPGTSPLAGATYGPLRAFAAQGFGVSALADPASSIYDPLLSGARAQDYTYPFPGIVGAHGGNGIVRLRIGGVGVAVDELLASATAPAHFTIVASYTPSPAPAATASPTPLPLVQFP